MNSRTRLVSCDLDGTLLGHPEATTRFADAWTALERPQRPLLVYNTGRTIEGTRGLISSGRLPEPDFIIGSVGTELYSRLYNLGHVFQARLADGWNLGVVERTLSSIEGIRPQPAEFLNPFRSSWFWTRARREDIDEVRGRLRDNSVKAEVLYSCRHFLDVVPACAGKGRALDWLCGRLGIASENVLVAGDSANDASMFHLAGVHGIVVGNALPELLTEIDPLRFCLSQASMADGVLEGLEYFGVVTPTTGRPP